MEKEWLEKVLSMAFNALKKNGKIIIFASDCHGIPVGQSTNRIIENLTGKKCEKLEFVLPNIEYNRKKGVVKKEIAWIGTKE